MFIPLPPIWMLIFPLIIGTLSPNSVSITPSTAKPTDPTLISNNQPEVKPPVQTESLLTTNLVAEKLAKCLTKKGAAMYGAYWCSHCSDQKTTFGSAFQYIKYIECDPKGEKADSKACQKAQIKNYPTWIMPGHESLEGTQGLSDLASWSKCSF